MGIDPGPATGAHVFDNQEIYELIMEHTRDLIRVIDVDFNFVYVSPSHETVLGYSVDEMVHSSGLNILHPDDKDRAIAMHRHMISQDVTMDGLFRFQRKTGEWITLETRGRSLVKDGQIIGVVTVGRDVTERLRMEQQVKDYQEQLKFMAFHDPLTGLPNRALFFETASQVVAEANQHGDQVAVLFVDCDDLKQINDAYGHDVGDNAIRELGKSLAMVVGDQGIVARVGGDEFTVLLPHLGAAQDVLAIVDRLSRSTHAVRDAKLVTVSIGVAVYPSDGIDVDTLVQKADRALYAAKRQGKNRCVFVESLS